MKRNVYLAMKGLPEAREIFSRAWREKKTVPEQIKPAARARHSEACGQITQRCERSG